MQIFYVSNRLGSEIVRDYKNKKSVEIKFQRFFENMAERVGFEPTVPVKEQQFSRLPDSTALAPLREFISLTISCRKFQVEKAETRA